MGLIKKISSSEDLPEIKIIEFDTFSDLRGEIWTSFVSDLAQEILPGSTPQEVRDATKSSNTRKGINCKSPVWKNKPQCKL